MDEGIQTHSFTVQQQEQISSPFLACRENHTKKIIISEPQRLVSLKLQLPQITNLKQKEYSQIQQQCDEQFEQKELNIVQKNASIVYQKIDNSCCKTYLNQQYAASCFLPLPLKLSQQLHSMLQILPNGYSHRLGPIFNSNFQSGNLQLVLRKSDRQYDLLLHNDYNSTGYTQWFYFCVKGFKALTTVRFNIINLSKNDSLFKKGMQPAVYSSHKPGGWHRVAKILAYYKNGFLRQKSKKHYYTLSFSYQFRGKDQQVYFSHSYPYTTKMLKQYISSLVQNPAKSKYIQLGVLCKTLGENKVMIINVSQWDSSQKKKIVIILARQHPGQTPSSFVLQGIINMLTGSSKQAKALRKNYIFKIVPIVNVDGVIVGNYRCSMTGSDLNRKWVTSTKGLYPEVIAIKKIVTDLHKQRKLRYLLDLHGHSRKLGSFFYGNSSKHYPQQTRLLALICSKINPNISYQDSTYNFSLTKRSTARQSLAGMFGAHNISTFQTSFYGINKQGKRKAFSTEDMRKIGQSIGSGFFYYLLGQNYDKKCSQYKFYSKALQILKSKTFNQQSNSDSGSDSQPQQYSIDPTLIPKPTIIQPQQLIKCSAIQFFKYGTKKQFYNKTMQVNHQSNHRNLRVLQIGKVQSKFPQKRTMVLQPQKRYQSSKIRSLSQLKKRSQSTFKQKEHYSIKKKSNEQFLITNSRIKSQSNSKVNILIKQMNLLNKF